MQKLTIILLLMISINIHGTNQKLITCYKGTDQQSQTHKNSLKNLRGGKEQIIGGSFFPLIAGYLTVQGFIGCMGLAANKAFIAYTNSTNNSL